MYSSKIEGDEIEFDSFYKHKFLKVATRMKTLQNSLGAVHFKGSRMFIFPDGSTKLVQKYFKNY